MDIRRFNRPSTEHQRTLLKRYTFIGQMVGTEDWLIKSQQLPCENEWLIASVKHSNWSLIMWINNDSAYTPP